MKDINSRSILKYFIDPSNQRTIYSLSAVLFIVLFSLFVAPRIAFGNRYLALMYLGFLGIFAAVIFLRWPSLLILLIPFSSFFIPFEGPGGINSTVLLVASSLVIWGLEFILQSDGRKISRSRTLTPALFLLLSSIISLIISQFRWFSDSINAPADAQIGGFSIFILSVGAFFLVSNMFRDQRRLEWFTWIFIALGALNVLGTLVNVPVDRFYQNSAIANSMFWIWLLAMVFSQALLNNRLNPIFRSILFIMSLLITYVAFVINYDWKSGWAPALIVVAVILTIRYWRIARVVAPFILIPTFIYLANRAIASDQYSWGTRLDAWIIVIEIAKANPIFGLGFANYYWYTRLIPFRGYTARFNSHSQYVDLFAQVGLFGLICFLWFFAEVGWLAFQLRNRVDEGFPRAYVYAVFGGVVGTLVAAFLVDWVIPFVYNIGMNGFRASVFAWIFMGGLVSIEQSVRAKSEPQVTD